MNFQGADEQLGGYSKHKATFVHGGRESLLIELQRQMDAISERNLGRDNRIVSDHGVAGRFPFLDERVVNYLVIDYHFRLMKSFTISFSGESSIGDQNESRPTKGPRRQTHPTGLSPSFGPGENGARAQASHSIRFTHCQDGKQKRKGQ